MADRQPAGLIAVGQRREQEAVCRRKDQPRRLGRDGGGIARRSDALQHQIVAAADRLLEPVVEAEHRRLFTRQRLRQWRGRGVFLQAEPGHGRTRIGRIAAEFDLGLEKAARTPQAVAPDESIEVVDRLAELQAQIGDEIAFRRAALRRQLDALQHRLRRQVVDRHHEADGAAGGLERDVDRATA